MAIRRARGVFLGCTRYPECKNSMPLPPEMKAALPARPKAIMTSEACPDCGKPMVIRDSKRGKFLGCSGYPKCRGTRSVEAEELAELLAKASSEG